MDNLHLEVEIESHFIVVVVLALFGGVDGKQGIGESESIEDGSIGLEGENRLEGGGLVLYLVLKACSS